jgi:aspartate/methionine/tyrosine aminotransferase
VFRTTEYLVWVRKHHARAEYDLASSGIPVVRWDEIGLPRPDIDDFDAYPRFRAALAAYNDVPPEEVIPAAGAAHGIFLAYAAIADAGDEILLETPSYEPMTRAAEGLGVHVRTFERREADGFRVDPERVAALMTPRTRAIVVSTLHNPSGVRLDESTLVELAAIAAARGSWVIVNEIYAAFDDLPEDGVFRKSSRRLASNIVAISSLTKCYGLGSYRLGWVLAPPEVIERAAQATLATMGYLPLVHAAYGIAALSKIGVLAVRAKEILSGKREIAARWAVSLPNARWSAPPAGLFGLVTLPGRGDLRASIEDHARTSGVLVGPGTFFGLPESFRVSWANGDRAHFEEGLRRLTSLVVVPARS